MLGVLYQGRGGGALALRAVAGSRCRAGLVSWPLVILSDLSPTRLTSDPPSTVAQTRVTTHQAPFMRKII